MTVPVLNADSIILPANWTFLEPITGDASARRYARIEQNGRRAVLMDCTNERTDRPGMAEFIKIAQWLRDHEVHAPEIYEIDERQKYLILEDLGDVSLRRAIDDGGDIRALYTLAGDLLSHMREADDLPDLPRYEDSFIHEKHADVIRIFYPAMMKQQKKDVQDVRLLEHAYREVWRKIERALQPCPQGFVHGDYHLENLMYVSGETGLRQLGLIDFQDAMIGPAPYDLANVLRDARRDVPQDLQKEILRGFDENFLGWYRVLALQFHCRVIGLFMGFYVHDGRDAYMQHIPRLAQYIETSLQEDLFKPLKEFFDDIALSFRQRSG